LKTYAKVDIDLNKSKVTLTVGDVNMKETAFFYLTRILGYG